MAENKKSIVVYSDWLPQFEQLSDEEAGKLIKHFFRYVNDLNPEVPDRLTQIAFEPIKQSLKRDLKKWEKVVEKRSIAGKASAEARKKQKEEEQYMLTHVEKNQHMLNCVKKIQHNSTNSTDSVNVNENVNVNEIIINNNNIKKGEIKNFAVDDDFQNLKFSDELKFESPSWLESVSMQQKISIEEIRKKIDDFVLFLKTTQEVHKTKKLFIQHFINWLTKKQNSQKNGTESKSAAPNKQPFRFSFDELAKTQAGET